MNRDLDTKISAFYIAMIFWQIWITFYPFLYHKANETVD